MFPWDFASEIKCDRAQVVCTVRLGTAGLVITPGKDDILLLFVEQLQINLGLDLSSVDIPDAIAQRLSCNLDSTQCG